MIGWQSALSFWQVVYAVVILTTDQTDIPGGQYPAKFNTLLFNPASELGCVPPVPDQDLSSFMKTFNFYHLWLALMRLGLFSHLTPLWLASNEQLDCSQV